MRRLMTAHRPGCNPHGYWALGLPALDCNTHAAEQAACPENAFECAFRGDGVVDRYASFC